MEIWMGQESLNKEERLFLYLVSTFKTSAWIALGKVKNPVTKKIEVNLDQASYYIDLLSMLQSKARGNMSEYEEQMLINTVSELKMKFIQEQSPKDHKHEVDENIANGTLEEE
jgi:hypothetical protein|tara:strand:+ start:7867 stop:8205 length:339 start_codon:yes stop_codon:yes gene_type:complete